jgi:hypothetical protein
MYKNLPGNPKEKDLLGSSTFKRDNVKWILRKYDGRIWSRYVWLRVVAG